MRSFLLVLLVLVAFTLNSIFGRGQASWGVGFVYIGYDTFLLLFVAWQMLKVLRKDSQMVDHATPTAPTLAVLITARNEASVLPECLAALEKQIDPADIIYWIDDGSTDETLSLLEQYNASHDRKIKVYAKAHSGKANSLNEVWPLVQTDVVLTIDADTFLEAGAILAMRNAFARNSNLMATGGILTPLSQHRPGNILELFQRFEYIRSFLSRRAWMTQNALLLVSGAFAAYRKQALVETGGYDPKSFVEDYDLIHRIHRYGYENGKNYEVQVTVAARAVTDVPATLPQFLRQRQRWFAGFLQTQFKNLDMIGNKSYGKVGTRMLIIKSADTLQPIFGLVALFTLIIFISRPTPFPRVILIVLVAKIILDLIFHYASVALYYRWSGTRPEKKVWLHSTLATFLEPVSFQIFRHTAALYGWVSFLRNKSVWSPQRKISLENK